MVNDKELVYGESAACDMHSDWHGLENNEHHGSFVV